MKAARSAEGVGKAAECVELDRVTAETAPTRTVMPHASLRTSYQAFIAAPSHLCIAVMSLSSTSFHNVGGWLKYFLTLFIENTIFVPCKRICSFFNVCGWRTVFAH